MRADLVDLQERFPILKERAHQPAGTMSGGEQQILAISRALMARPQLLMLDEPSMGLSPRNVQVVYDILQELKERGTTILLVEQNARAALRLADRGYVIETGRIILDGTAGGTPRGPGGEAGLSGQRLSGSVGMTLAVGKGAEQEFRRGSRP